MKRRLQEAGEAVKSGLAGLFGLRVYGESLLTRRVQSEMTTFALVLAIQFAVDFWAWSRAWSYGLPTSYLWPPFLGMAFAIAILLFDRGVVVADTSGSRRQYISLAGRAALLILISFITAVPTELAVFEAEISNRLEAKEKKATDKIRADSLAEEEKTGDKRIADAQRELDKVLGGSAVLRAQLDAYKAERAQGTEALQARVDGQRDALNREMQGLTGTSGRYGEGPAARGMRSVLQEMEAAKQAYDAETQIGIKAREAALAGKTDKDEQVARTALVKRREEKEKTLATLRVMPPEELGKKYGGQWRQAKGFLARFSELREMERESAAVRWMVWGCRLVMVIMGMLVLGLKLLSSEEFRRYYSFPVQAAHGAANDVVQMADALGYTDARARKALGFLPKVKDRLRDLEHARHNLLKQLHGFQQEFARLSQAGESGLCWPLTLIRNELHRWWADHILPQTWELAKAEESCRLDGVPVPAPTDELVIFLAANEPWKVEIAALVELGWRDPTSETTAARRALETLRGLQRQVEDVLRGLYAELHTRVTRDPEISRRKLVSELEPRRFTVWSARVVPLLRQMEDAERTIREGGERVPSWISLAQFTAMERLTAAWRVPDDPTLRQQYGWRAPYEHEPVPPPATSDAKPAAEPSPEPVAAVSEPIPTPVTPTATGDGAPSVGACAEEKERENIVDITEVDLLETAPAATESTPSDDVNREVTGGDVVETEWLETGNGLHHDDGKSGDGDPEAEVTKLHTPPKEPAPPPDGMMIGAKDPQLADLFRQPAAPVHALTQTLAFIPAVRRPVMMTPDPGAAMRAVRKIQAEKTAASSQRLNEARASLLGVLAARAATTKPDAAEEESPPDGDGHGWGAADESLRLWDERRRAGSDMASGVINNGGRRPQSASLPADTGNTTAAAGPEPATASTDNGMATTGAVSSPAKSDHTAVDRALNAVDNLLVRLEASDTFGSAKKAAGRLPIVGRWFGRDR